MARLRRVHILIRDAAPSCSSEGQGLTDMAFEESECWSQSEEVDEEAEADGGNLPAAVALDRNFDSAQHRQCGHSHIKQQKQSHYTATAAASALSTAWWREWSDFMNQTAPVHHNLDRNVIKADLEDEFDDMPPLIGGGFAEVVNVKMNEVKVTHVAPQSAAEFDFFERQFEVD